MYKENFNLIGNILNIENFDQECLDKYDSYLDAIIEFQGSRDDILVIYDKYKRDILDMSLQIDEIKDRVMLDENNVIRHDKIVDEEIDIEKILSGDEVLNYFEKRAKNISILEAVNLINCYGMDELVNNSEYVKKQMNLGIFTAKTNIYSSEEERERKEKRMDIASRFGTNMVQYIENYDLLKSRIHSLDNFSNVPKEKERIKQILDNLNMVDDMLSKKDTKLCDILPSLYDEYEDLNRQMLKDRIESGELTLLHFIPSFDSLDDKEQDEHFLNEAENANMKEQYIKSKNNPFDLSLRVPLKNRYINHSLKQVKTKPTSYFSCSICDVRKINSHLNRQVAMGFSKVPLDAIKSINKGYNNDLDKFSFEKNSVALPDILEYIQNGGINETLIDWTKVKPSYIMIIKNEKDLSEDLISKVKQYSSGLNLDVKIHDEHKMEEKDDEKNEQGIYNAEDLRAFTKVKTKSNIYQKIKEFIKTKTESRGGIEI